MPLALLGTLSYNGYTFDGSSRITVQAEMVQDEAQRTILYQRQTITVHAIVADGAGTDDKMQAIKRKLGEQGRQLILKNRGFGDELRVNSPAGGVRDLKWGPVPKILHWEPIGADLACEIEWQVVVCVPYCDVQASVRSTGVMALNYDVEFSIDDRGDTTRTISGYLEIAQTRPLFGRQTVDSADQYRQLISPVLPANFKRTQTYHTSRDKSRLDFTVTDTQIPSKFPYPNGVVNASGKHRAGWSRSNRGSGYLRNTISVELEMAEGVAPATAWLIFGNLVSKRIRVALETYQRPVLLESLSIEEDIWGRASSFSLSYRVTDSLQNIVKQSGIWTPVDTDWTQWRASLSHLSSSRGTAGLIQLPQSDLIVDLCGSDAAINWSGVDRPKQPPNLQQYYTFKNKKPPKQQSYLDYQNQLQTSRSRPVSGQSILQDPDKQQTTEPNMTDPTKWNYGAPAGTNDVIQEGGSSSYFARLSGFAYRAGYEIPRPGAVKVGSQDATEIASEFVQRVVANWFGVPIYGAGWAIDYQLPNSPGEIKIPDNPREGVSSDGTTAQPGE